MTVNIAINLGSHAILMTDRLSTGSQVDLLSGEKTSGYFRDDEFALKIKAVPIGMVSTAGARRGMQSGAPLHVLNNVGLDKLNAGFLSDRLNRFHSRLEKSENPLSASSAALNSSFLLATTSVSRDRCRIFCVKPPSFSKADVFLVEEVVQWSAAWAFPLGLSEGRKEYYRNSVEEFISEFKVMTEVHGSDLVANDLDDMVRHARSLIISMSDENEYVNDNIMVGIVTSQGNRYEAYLNASDDDLEYTQIKDIDYTYINKVSDDHGFSM